jgi:hypothetical protein
MTDIVITPEQAIAGALTAFPDLTPIGFGAHADAEKFNPHQVATAIAFLQLCGPAKKPTIGSYSLKHLAEDWGGRFAGCPYITNGAVIVAAHALGLPIQPYHYGGPNAGIGINWRALEQVIARRQP